MAAADKNPPTPPAGEEVKPSDVASNEVLEQLKADHEEQLAKLRGEIDQLTEDKHKIADELSAAKLEKASSEAHAKSLSESLEASAKNEAKLKAEIEELEEFNAPPANGPLASHLLKLSKLPILDYTEYAKTFNEQNEEVIRPVTTVLNAEVPGELTYHQAVEFKEDSGYVLDSVVSRAIGCVHAALAPKRIGMNQDGSPAWVGFPPFDPSLKLNVAIWID